MPDEHARKTEERRLREAALIAAQRGAAPVPESLADEFEEPRSVAPVEEAEEADDPDDADDADDAAAQRMEQQTLWVDLQVRKAIERGDFDDLPGAGKPLKLPDRHDPDWWVKQLVEREKITGIAPPAIGLRKEDQELDGVLDREPTEDGVRRVIEEFNARVVDARRQLTGGPPVVTPTRDPDDEVLAWRARRAARIERNRQLREATAEAPARRTRWWRRS